MKHNRILVLTCVIIVAMVIPILLLQNDRPPICFSRHRKCELGRSPGRLLSSATTSGMQPEINQINAAWGQVGAYWNCLTCTYHLTNSGITFMPHRSKPNETQFGNWLGNLNAAGGGECSDNAYAGLREFVLIYPMMHLSQMRLSSLIHHLQAIGAPSIRADKMIENNVRVHNVGRALCNNENLYPITRWIALPCSPVASSIGPFSPANT